MIRARGLRPCALPLASEPSSTAAAPSTMPHELPAVCTWLIARVRVALRAPTRQAAHLAPISANAARAGPGPRAWSRGRDELVAARAATCRRGPRPAHRAPRSALGAAPPGALLRPSAKRSTSSREKPSSVAIRSAEMPCGTKSLSQLGLAGPSVQPPPSEPIGTRDIDSTPPPTTRSSSRSRPSSPRSSPPAGPSRRSG